MAFVVLFVVSSSLPWLELPLDIALLLVIALVIVDIIFLFRFPGITVERQMHERLSNGDDNEIILEIENRYAAPVSVEIIDETPIQFQYRNLKFKRELTAGQKERLVYTLRPFERGEYEFGAINVFVRSRRSLIERKIRLDRPHTVAVYPSFIQMRKYELLAATNRLTEAGIKRIRRVGSAREFDQIREYVPGDEYRTINWNATARRADLMVNQFQDEKSQSVYSLIDMGRGMKMPFEGMSLLDYAINASLVISDVAMIKDDKAGLITFGDSIETVLKAERGRGQLKKIMELLYKQHTGFLEPSFEKLVSTVRRNIPQRSLLILFSNFETVSNLKRQLPYLSMLASSHVLCVVLFENTELRQLIDSRPQKLEEVYIQTIAEKFAFEKKLIVRELAIRGIHTIHTAPSQLSVNTINAYLQLKARGVI